MITLTFIKRFPEEDEYRIMRDDKLMNNPVIIVSHLANNISFEGFIDAWINYTPEEINEILYLVDTCVIPKYEGYKILHNDMLGNSLYWRWKKDNGGI